MTVYGSTPNSSVSLKNDSSLDSAALVAGAAGG